jgi:hypothetical protein
MLVLVAAACTAAPGQGTLAVQVSGGNGVEAPVPSSEFQDGWALSFSRLLVVLADLSVTSPSDPSLAARDGRRVLVDLARRGPHAWATMTATAGAYDRAALSLRPATEDTVLVGATEADRARMVDAGWSLLAEGTLARGTTTRRFSWGFQASARHAACPLPVTVAEGATTTTRLTLHGEQLFLESLSAAAAPRLRAQPQVDADADGDGTITVEELGATDAGPVHRTLRAYEEQALVRSLRMPGEKPCASVTVDSPLSRDGGP